MSEVVQLSTRRPQRRIGSGPQGPADIHLFTGVRYERPPETESPEPDAKGAARRRTRPA